MKRFYTNLGSPYLMVALDWPRAACSVGRLGTDPEDAKTIGPIELERENGKEEREREGGREREILPQNRARGARFSCRELYYCGRGYLPPPRGMARRGAGAAQ